MFCNTKKRTTLSFILIITFLLNNFICVFGSNNNSVAKSYDLVGNCIEYTETTIAIGDNFCEKEDPSQNRIITKGSENNFTNPIAGTIGGTIDNESINLQDTQNNPKTNSDTIGEVEGTISKKDLLSQILDSIGILLSKLKTVIENLFNSDSTATPQPQDEFENVAGEVSIQNISDSEVKVVIDNRKTIISKNDKQVISKYYVDEELIETDTMDLEEAKKNGETIKKFMLLPEIPKFNPVLNKDNEFKFDGLKYVPKLHDVLYPHVDRDKYSILPSDKKVNLTGTNYMHIQIDQYWTNSILQFPAWTAGAILGTLIGATISKGTFGAVIGSAIGAALGAIAGGQVSRFADEKGCLWVIIDKSPKLTKVRGKYFWQSKWVYNGYLAIGAYQLQE